MNLRSIARVSAVLFALTVTGCLAIRAQRATQSPPDSPQDPHQDRPSGEQQTEQTLPVQQSMSAPASQTAEGLDEFGFPNGSQPSRPTHLYSSKSLVIEDSLTGPGSAQNPTEPPAAQLTDEEIFMFSSKSAVIVVDPETTDEAPAPVDQ